MRRFESLTEQEILALAIALEEEDARIYDDFADGLKESYPEQAEKFKQLRREEDGHRHRLLELYKQRLGDHVPHIRRQDVRGFVQRRPVWLVRPLGLKAVQKAAEAMEMGAAAVLVNTAIGTAGDPPAMGAAFRKAVEAGREGYLAGLATMRREADASSPLTGFLS